MRFEFATATQILYGAGTLREVAPLARAMGQRAFVVTGSNADRANALRTTLAGQGIEVVSFAVAGEPSTETVTEGVRRAQAAKCDVVIAVGGGSALDAGKAIAALLANDGDLLDYLEVIGKGKPLLHPSAPFIAIPTTAGTGAEVTRNAVLFSPAHRVKVSLRSPLMLPRAAIVDSELMHDLPPALTASTGLDALTQLIEPYVCMRANPMTDALCVEGIRRVAQSLRCACENGRDATAREDMALASLFGGLALANAGLGAVHGFAAPIGGMFSAPHGAICAALLPHVMGANVRALRTRATDGESLRRYDEVARLLTGRAQATADEGIRWVAELCATLSIPPLRSYGIKETDISLLVDNAAKASSMKANPIILTPKEMAEIVAQAL